MEEDAPPPGNDELEREKEARQLLEMELSMALKEVKRSKWVQVKMEAETILLLQKLEARQVKKQMMKERLVRVITQIEENVQKVEVRTSEQATINTDFWQHLEYKRSQQEGTNWQLQEELTDMQRKLSMSEASLKAKSHHCSDLMEENRRLQTDVNKLEKMLQEREDQSIQSGRYLNNLKRALDKKEREVVASSERLQEVLSAFIGMEKTVKQLEEFLRQMETENLRLEDIIRQQTNKITMLQQEAKDSAKVRKNLEEQLSWEVQKQDLLSLDAQLPQREMTTAPLHEKEQAGKTGVQQIGLQEQLELLQAEAMLLREQLEEAQMKARAQEQELMKMYTHFNSVLGKMQAENENVQMLNEQSQALADQNAELQALLELQKSDKETTLLQLQQQLVDARKKLLMCKVSLDVSIHHQSALEDENNCMQDGMDRLEGMLQESKDQYVQAEHIIRNLKNSLKNKECEVIASSQKLQEVMSTSAGMEKTVKQLKESLQQIKAENTRLEETVKQQANIIAVLEKEAEQATTVKPGMEKQLSPEIQTDQGQLKEIEPALPMVSERTSETKDLQEELQAQLEEVQKECMLLREQLEEAQKKAEMKEQEVQDIQDYFNNTLTERQAYVEDRVQMAEKRSKELASKNAELQELLDLEKTDKQTTLFELQRELAETQVKLSMCEASLKASTCQCKDLEEEKVCMQNNMQSMAAALAEKNSNITTSSKGLQVFPASASMEKTVKELQETVLRLEAENVNLETTTKQQSNTIVMLQKVAEEATRVKKDLEEQLIQGVKSQSLVSQATHIKLTETEAQLHAEKERVREIMLLQDALQKQLEQVQNEYMTLYLKLQDAQKTAKMKDEAMTSMEKCLHDTVAKMDAFSEEKIRSVKKRGKGKALQEVLDCNTLDQETALRQLEQDLAETETKKSKRKAPLDISIGRRSDLKEEELSMDSDLSKLEESLRE